VHSIATFGTPYSITTEHHSEKYMLWHVQLVSIEFFSIFSLHTV